MTIAYNVSFDRRPWNNFETTLEESLRLGDPKMFNARIWIMIGMLCLSNAGFAQNTREQAVRRDKEHFATDTTWIYNDLHKGIDAAKTSGQPMLVVFRCLP